MMIQMTTIRAMPRKMKQLLLRNVKQKWQEADQTQPMRRSRRNRKKLNYNLLNEIREKVERLQA